MEKKDIVDFFHKQRCDNNCPFKEECDKMYGKIRGVTTDTFSLCDAIFGDILDF